MLTFGTIFTKLYEKSDVWKSFLKSEFHLEQCWFQVIYAVSYGLIFGTKIVAFKTSLWEEKSWVFDILFPGSVNTLRFLLILAVNVHALVVMYEGGRECKTWYIVGFFQ